MNISMGKFVVVNETSGNVCSLNNFGRRSSNRGRMIAPRSTCYRVKREFSRRFPFEVYAVYELVRLGKR